uniref:trichohyalin-like n=1 Tax=Myxine glutinosa TaxID=7769 RepID=UPI00358FDC91
MLWTGVLLVAGTIYAALASTRLCKKHCLECAELGLAPQNFSTRVCALECEQGVPSMAQWATCRNSLEAASNNNPQMSFITPRQLAKRSAEFPGEEGEGAVEEAFPVPHDIDADQVQKILNEKNAASHDLLHAIKMEEARESGDVFRQKPYEWTEDRDEELHKDIANALHDFLHEKLMKELEADGLSNHRHMEVTDVVHERGRPSENTHKTLQRDKVGGRFEDVQRGIPAKEAKRYGSFLRDAREREVPANEPGEEIDTNQRKRYGGFFGYSKRLYPENESNLNERDIELRGVSKKEQTRYGGFIRESDDEKLGEQRRGEEQLPKRYGGFIRQSDDEKLGEQRRGEEQLHKRYGGFIRESDDEKLGEQRRGEEQLHKRYGGFIRESDDEKLGEQRRGEEQLHKRYGGFIRESDDEKLGEQRRGGEEQLQKRYGGFIRESDGEKLGEQRRGEEQLHKRYGGFIRESDGEKLGEQRRGEEQLHKRYGGFIRESDDEKLGEQRHGEEQLHKRYGGFVRESDETLGEQIQGEDQLHKRYGGFVRESDETLGEQIQGEDQLHKRYGGFVRSNSGGITFNERKRNKEFLSLQKHSAPEDGRDNVDDKTKFGKGSTPFSRQGQLHPSDSYGDHEGGLPELQKRYGGFLRFRKLPNSESNEEEIQWPSFRSLQGYRK